MKQRLSKIAREFGCGISTIAAFLNENGYDCSEDPNEELSMQVVETIRHNIRAYLAEKYKEDRLEGRRGQQKDKQESITEIPLEIKIIEAAAKEQKLIERVVGFTDFEWEYMVAEYEGESSQPVPFNLFEEVISKLLLVEEMSAEEMGSILGLDIDHDPAEKEVLMRAVDNLKSDEMIDGDESILWLTDSGREYARNGVKFSTFSRSFELYYDLTGDLDGNVRSIFSELKSERTSTEVVTSVLESTLDEIRKLAEVQAPEIHFPEKGYHLVNARLKEAKIYEAKVWIILLENFRDNVLRVLVYDEKQNKINEELSAGIDQDEKLKQEILDQLVSVDEDIEYTDEQKSEGQLQIEATLIDKQKEFEQALNSREEQRIISLHREVIDIKRHFSSIEFEIELKRLFDQTNTEMWILSPWIKNATFKRIPFFKRYINKGGKIFVAYSKPEGEGQIMAYEEPLEKLLELERNHPGYFFINQLSPFHYKNVWIRDHDDSHIYYSGSYNILSFFVSQGSKNVRQEKMTRMEWDESIERDFRTVQKDFALHYLQKVKSDFELLLHNPMEKIDRSFLTRLSKPEKGRMKPFLHQQISEFESAYEEFQKFKTEKIFQFRKKFYWEQLLERGEEVYKLLDKPITANHKRRVVDEFSKLRDEFEDIPDFRDKENEIKEQLKKIRIVQLKGKKNSIGKKRR